MTKIKKTLLAGLTVLPATGAVAWDLKLGNQTVEFHGFASQGFLYTSDYNYLGDTEDGSFEFSELGLNASISPFKRTRITAQGFLFDVGDVGNYKPFLDYASLEYTFNDYIGLRAGRVRRQNGIYNHIQDVDLARTTVLLPQSIYDARLRDLSASVDGGMAFGNVPMSKAGSLSYEVSGGIMRISDDGGVAKQIENPLPSFMGLDSIDDVTIVSGQLWWNTPLQGLRAGLSLGYLDNGLSQISGSPFPGITVSTDAEFHGTIQQYSLEYLWKSWTFQAEYQSLNFSTKSTTRTAGVPVPPAVDTDRNRSDAWYLSAAYRVNDWMEVGTYYTEYYADVADRNGSSLAVPADGYQRDAALSFRFDPTSWWIIKLEGHYLRGTALLDDDRHNPERDKSHWWMFAAKTTFYF